MNVKKLLIDRRKNLIHYFLPFVLGILALLGFVLFIMFMEPFYFILLIPLLVYLRIYDLAGVEK